MLRPKVMRATFSQNDVDVQMMETDIMRFLAIIALCLAIIFALVSGASHSIKQQSTAVPVPAKTVPAQQVLAKPSPQLARAKPVLQRPDKKPPPLASKPDATPAKMGFQLKFESAQVFTQLLNTRHIQLYFIGDKQVWTWRDAWQKATLPPRYYAMHSDTVPAQYYQSAKRSGGYAVVLPLRTEKQIQQLSSQFTSGQLNINVLAEVERTALP